MNTSLPTNKFSARGLTVAICLLITNLVFGDDEPVATPYRPTASNPADLPTPGWLELEFGGQHQKADDAHQISLPYLFKYAFTPDWGVLVGGDAYIRNTDTNGNSMSGFGDTQLLLKHRIPISEGRALGFETGVRAPTAKTGLGSGKADYIFTGIFSNDFGAMHLDINLGPTRLGAPEQDTGRVEWNGSAALSKNLNDRWNVAGELSATQRHAVATQSKFLIALAYSATKRTVFDFGFAKGLTDASPDYTIFAGVTTVLGRLR